MARKKQEIQLQVEIETQEEWEEMLSKEGMTVVDVYQEWSGPCKSMVASLKRTKNELGDDLLRFAVAKSDTVDALERYRGRCQPCFLFFGGGALVAVIRGAKAPLILHTIAEQLRQERKVLDGDTERKEIRDPMFAHLDEKEKASDDEFDEDDEAALPSQAVASTMSKTLVLSHEVDIIPQSNNPKGVQKEVTVAIIKPNVVADGRVEEVIQQMKEAGIEILAHEERQLTEEEARSFYAHKAEEEYFDELVSFMSSGPSHVLVLTKGEEGENIIQEWRELMGPPVVEDAKEAAPESFRAKYGSEKHANALHGSDSQETAMRELAFFFPNFAIPTVSGGTKPTKKTKIQRTLALIRPDALKSHKDEILEKIREAGFTVALQKEVQLTKDQAKDFYKEHEGEEYFDELVERMICGPVLALGLAREDAVQGWRNMLGPKELEKAKEETPDSLRAQYAIEDVKVNQLHGSDSTTTAEQELEFFFPMQQTLAAIKPDAYQTKDEIMDRIREAGFNIAAQKETELSKEMAEQFYKDVQGKEYMGDLVGHMTSGPTLFMVLSREDAVEGWREVMGVTDPEQAKETNPDSLRAQYGTDIKANALHGSSNVDHAKDNIQMIFGDIDFNPDESKPGTPAEKGGSVAGDKEDEDDKGGDDERQQDEEEAQQAEEGGEKKGETEQEEGETEQEGAKGDDAGETEQAEGATSKGDEDKKDAQTEDQEQAGDEEKKDGDEEKKDGDEEKKDEGEEAKEGEPEAAKADSPVQEGEKKGEEAADEGEKKGEEENQAAAADSESKKDDGEGEAAAKGDADEKKEDDKKEEDKPPETETKAD